MPTVKNANPARNPDDPKFTIVPSDGECFAIVTPADDHMIRTYADVPERPVIAFKVYVDGRRPVPVTLCGTDWTTFPDRWAIRDANGWAISDRGEQYRDARSFLHAVRKPKIAAA